MGLLAVRPLGDERIAQSLGVDLDELFELTWRNARPLGVDVALFPLVLAGAESHLAHVGAVLRVGVIVELDLGGTQRLSLLESLAQLVD